VNLSSPHHEGIQGGFKTSTLDGGEWSTSEPGRF